MGSILFGNIDEEGRADVDYLDEVGAMLLMWSTLANRRPCRLHDSWCFLACLRIPSVPGLRRTPLGPSGGRFRANLRPPKALVVEALLCTRSCVLA